MFYSCCSACWEISTTEQHKKYKKNNKKYFLSSIKQNKPCKLIKNTYYTDMSYLLVFDDLLIAFQRLYFKSNICSVKAFLSHVLVRVFLACTALTSRHHQWLCSELRNGWASSSNYRCSPETCKWEELTQEQQVGGAYDKNNKWEELMPRTTSGKGLRTANGRGFFASRLDFIVGLVQKLYKYNAFS